MTTATVPVTVTSEAVAFVRDKGYERVLEQLLEHTIHEMPGIQRIRVVREVNYTHEGDLGITLEVAREQNSDTPEGDFDWEWSKWLMEHYSPEVCMHFHILSNAGEDHGR